MARRVSWTNNSSGHTGTYVYRAPTIDPQALPSPVATINPVAQGETAEWIDNETITAGDYDYAVQDFDGQGVGTLSAVVGHNITLVVPNVGDEWQGGIYAGIHTISGTDYHMIVAKQAGEIAGLQWRTTRDHTPGVTDLEDGQVNMQAIQSVGISLHPAAEHCANYSGGGFDDWYLPARLEYAWLWDNLISLGGSEFSTNLSERRWTSTGEGRLAYVIRYSDGYATGGRYVDDTAPTRPVRRVLV